MSGINSDTAVASVLDFVEEPTVAASYFKNTGVPGEAGETGKPIQHQLELQMPDWRQCLLALIPSITSRFSLIVTGNVEIKRLHDVQRWMSGMTSGIIAALQIGQCGEEDIQDGQCHGNANCRLKKHRCREKKISMNKIEDKS